MTTTQGGKANELDHPVDQQRSQSRHDARAEPVDLDVPRGPHTPTSLGQDGMGFNGQSPSILDGRAVESVTHLHELTYERSGPLPTIEEFAGYEQVLPGGADRIMTMAEKALDAEIASQRTTDRAEALAFVGAALAVSWLPWFLFATAAFLALKGLDTAALIAAIAGAVSGGPQIIQAAKRMKPQPRPAAQPSQSTQSAAKTAAPTKKRKSSKKKRRK